MPIEAASDRVLHDVRALLGRVGLPTAGLEDQFPGGYAVATVHGELVGCAGLEIHGRAGLLRSVAVIPHGRRAGLGRALVADRLAAARAGGLGFVYLLTTTAPNFFWHLGFTFSDRARVPPEIASCQEFAGVCPASAACLSLRV